MSRANSPMKSIKPGSAASSPQKSPKKVTRFGVVSASQPAFAKEERFAWQKAQYVSDSIYDVKDEPNTRNVLFGTSLRRPLNEQGSKSSTGPGSYDFVRCYDFSSEYSKREGNKFSCAPRQSMAIKTPSPGAVYNIENCYWNGPEKPIALGFACSTRGALYGGSMTADADMFIPQPEHGPAITMAGRPKPRTLEQSTPGAVYDVHNKVNFKTGPSFSFGKGKGNRFSDRGFLPEPEDW